MKEYFTHFAEVLSPEIKQYAIEEVFKHSQYIFTRRQGKQQYGYCSHCSSEFRTDGIRHNSEYICPDCKSNCIVKASGMGRSRLVDEAYFIYYEKSVKDPKVVIARGIYAVRDYSGDYYWTKTLYLERSRYVFEMGKSIMFERYGYYSQAKTMQHGEFSERKSIYSMFSQFNSDFRRNMTVSYSRQSIVKSIQDTPFSWSGWESYTYDGMVKFFDLYSKYPCVEYLTKLGFDVLVETKLTGGNTYGAINWRGKTLFKVLKLNKSELKEVKESKIFIEPLLLKLLQMSRKDKSDLSLTELSNIQKKYGYYIKDLQKVLKYTTFRRVNSFLNKQLEKNKFTDDRNKERNHYGNEGQVLFAWRDYIADCATLEMDLADEQVLFPRELYTAHQNTIKQVKVKEDKTLRITIKARAKALEKYRFEYAGFIISPAKSAIELISEGKDLHHCVGTYAARYAKGETSIFFVRKLAEPNKPYFTVEVKDNEIIQIRGNNNCSPNKEVEAFIEAFTNQKLNQEKEKRRSRIAIPA